MRSEPFLLEMIQVPSFGGIWSDSHEMMIHLFDLFDIYLFSFIFCDVKIFIFITMQIVSDQWFSAMLSLFFLDFYDIRIS